MGGGVCQPITIKMNHPAQSRVVFFFIASEPSPSLFGHIKPGSVLSLNVTNVSATALMISQCSVFVEDQT